MNEKKMALKCSNLPLPSKKKRIFKMGAYIRLSKEDINKSSSESDSIIHQKKLLADYYKQHIDEFEYFEAYVDDGYSGTDTNREGFQMLLADIYAKKINCVIVKDLSRLSRNYADAGAIIENLFVSMDIRFISLGDNIDSYLNPDSVCGLIVPITNVMNDHFSYQTSKKIRQVFDYKRRSGEFIGSFAAFGYKKNPDDKNALMIDEQAAAVVKDIYLRFIGGMSKSAIVKQLNAYGIPCPTEYKKAQGLNYYNPHAKEKSLWSTKTITAILKNRMYTGDMVQGKQRIKSYKIHVLEQVAPSDWFIVPHTHEPIIDKDIFEKAQTLLAQNVRTAYGSNTPHLFSGFLRCADCGKSMSRVKTKSYIYYFCRTYKTFGSYACTRHSIRHDILECYVCTTLNEHISTNESSADSISKISLLSKKYKHKRVYIMSNRFLNHISAVRILFISPLYISERRPSISYPSYHETFLKAITIIDIKIIAVFQKSFSARSLTGFLSQ